MHYGNDSKELKQMVKNRKFVTDYNYDLDGNFEHGVSFLATVLKQENLLKTQLYDIEYKPQKLPRRLEESSRRLLLPSSTLVSTQWGILQVFVQHFLKIYLFKKYQFHFLFFIHGIIFEKYFEKLKRSIKEGKNE